VKRDNGDGSVFVRRTPGRSDRYVAEVTLDIVEGRQRRRRRIFDTEKEATKGLAAMVAERDAGIIGSSATVNVYLADYMAHHLPARTAKGKRITPATLDNYAHIASHIYVRIGNVRVDRLTPRIVEDKLLRPMASAGLSGSTIKRVRSLLSMCLKHAVSRGDVQRNAAELATIPHDARPPVERKSLTAEQARDLLQAAEGDRLGAAVITQLALGLRPGEVLGLKWDDLQVNVIQIQRSVKLERGTLILGDTKTERSTRPLGVPEVVLDALSWHRVLQDAERAKAEPLGLWEDHGLIFTTAYGTPVDLHNYRRTVRRLISDAGIPGEWTSHELRHTAISLLCDAGVPLDRLADQMGHTDTRMIERTYRHRLGTAVDAAVAPMDALFAAS
jgi:integrase